MTKLMSPSTKSQLKEAVYDMTVLTDDGLHPSSALEKIASDNSFTDDQLRIIAKTYNTATSIDQRKKCSSLLDWLETYPIADVEAVLERRKKKAQVEESVKTASVWDTPLDRNKQYQKPQLKLACLKVSKAEPAPAAPVKVDPIAIRKQIAEEEIKLAYLKPSFDSMASCLRRQVKAMPAHKQEAVKYAAVSRYGNDIRDYFDTVFAETTISIPKVASTVSSNDPVIDLLGNLKKCAEEIVTHVSNIGKLSASILDLKKKAADPNQSSKDGILSQFPLFTGPVSTVLGLNKTLLGVNDDFNKRFEKLRSPSSTSVSTAVLGPKSLTFGIESPSERQSLKKIELQSVLNDLRYNDPIISEYDDDRISDAFNEISSVAPTISEKPTMLRAMMREYLAKDGLGMYDLHSILGDEKSVIEADSRRRAGLLAEQRASYEMARDSYALSHPPEQKEKDKGNPINITNNIPKPERDKPKNKNKNKPNNNNSNNNNNNNNNNPPTTP
jgi:hypothetical protein